jgi:hypothetical protein
MSDKLQSHLQNSLIDTRFQPGGNNDRDTLNRFNGFCSSFAPETVETVKVFFQNLTTRLKPGVNERVLQELLQFVVDVVDQSFDR